MGNIDLAAWKFRNIVCRIYRMYGADAFLCLTRQRSGEINFWEAECLKIDAANKRIFCKSNLDENLVGSNEFSLEYDYLVIAIGAEVNTFNTPGVLEHCHFLKVPLVH